MIETIVSSIDGTWEFSSDIDFENSDSEENTPRVRKSSFTHSLCQSKLTPRLKLSVPALGSSQKFLSWSQNTSEQSSSDEGSPRKQRHFMDVLSPKVVDDDQEKAEIAPSREAFVFK